MVTLLFALLAGMVTVAAPCTLPVLPVLFGASIGQTSKTRPVFIALGFVASFTIVAIGFSAITQIVGIDPDRLRTVAVGLLLIFGLLMLWPRPFEWLGARAGNLLNRVPRIPIKAQSSGNVGGFILGTTLGLVWTPCAGPVLASILTVIATAPHIEWKELLLIVYAVGAAVPMLAIAYGGQFVTTRVRSIVRISHRLQQGFGAVIIVFAAATYLQYDTLITAWFSEFYPNGQFGL
jgi:cytochrome c-type biogenesis protein